MKRCHANKYDMTGICCWVDFVSINESNDKWFFLKYEKEGRIKGLKSHWINRYSKNYFEILTILKLSHDKVRWTEWIAHKLH